MVYACFVAKKSKMAFTRFGGQFQVEKSMVGRLDNSGAGQKGGGHSDFIYRVFFFKGMLPLGKSTQHFLFAASSRMKSCYMVKIAGVRSDETNGVCVYHSHKM